MSTTWHEHVVLGLGAWGSATAYELARAGRDVLGLEQHALGHDRGASHDTSRILRHSYHTPCYVELTRHAYDDWARLEHDSGERLVTTVGGVDLFPPDAAIRPDEYTASLAAADVPFTMLDAAELVARWPQLRLPDGVRGLHQERGSIVPAARGTATLADGARRHGAVLRDRTPVRAIEDLGDDGVELRLDGEERARCRRLVVTADAWAERLLAPLGVRLGLVTTLEQVTYFAPPDPAPFQPGRLPLWIWMDDPSFYGFPCYGEDTVKAAQDCGGAPVDPDRGAEHDGTDPVMLALLAEHVQSLLPGVGEPVRSKRCLYTLTPDRDFVLGVVPDHPGIVAGLGAAHGFKFTPTAGRLLAELATSTDGRTTRPGVDLDAFAVGRSALSDPDYAAHWLV